MTVPCPSARTRRRTERGGVRARARRPAWFLAFVVVALLGLPATSSAADAPGTLSIVAGTGAAEPPTPGPATNSALNFPYAVTLGPDGSFYIGDLFNFVVERVGPDGNLSVVAGNGAYGTPSPGPATSTSLGAPNGMVVDKEGNLYIADAQDDLVEKVTPGGTLSVVAGTGTGGPPTPGPAVNSNLNSPQDVAVDAEGNLYISDGSNGVVEKVTPGGTLSIVANVGQPGGLAVDSAGNLFITDRSQSQVLKLDAQGMLSVIAGTGTTGAPTPGPATSSDLFAPSGVAVDAQGNVFIADGQNHLIEKVDPAGILSIVAGEGSSGAPVPGPAASSPLGFPSGVAVDGLGNLYVSDASSNVIAKVTPAAPVNVIAPTISGDPEVGQTLTAEDDDWNNSPTRFTYQWMSCDAAGSECTPIPGATGRSYQVTEADRGRTLKVVVTGINGGGSASAGSSVSKLVAARPVVPTTPAASPGNPPTKASTPPSCQVPVTASATSFAPLRRPGKVVPGVRAKIKVSTPSQVSVAPTLIYTAGGKVRRAALSTSSFHVTAGQKLRLPVPKNLRQALPLGTAVRLALSITVSPDVPGGCASGPSTTHRANLNVKVVKVLTGATS